jgi:hypothetical protein
MGDGMLITAQTERHTLSIHVDGDTASEAFFIDGALLASSDKYPASNVGDKWESYVKAAFWSYFRSHDFSLWRKIAKERPGLSPEVRITR